MIVRPRQNAAKDTIAKVVVLAVLVGLATLMIYPWYLIGTALLEAMR